MTACPTADPTRSLVFRNGVELIGVVKVVSRKGGQWLVRRVAGGELRDGDTIYPNEEPLRSSRLAWEWRSAGKELLRCRPPR